MRLRHDETDAALGAAWDAFAREDAAATAPPKLERRVFRAVQAAAHRRKRGRFEPHLRVGLGVAAAALLIAGISVWNLSQREREAPAQIRSDAPVEATDIVLEPLADRPQLSGAALITLAADRIRDTESLQLVRVRIPRTALTALGVALIEPEAAALVDVDVLVGDDGLPLDVRRIRPVVDRPQRQSTGHQE
jgi:hypothetical protein